MTSEDTSTSVASAAVDTGVNPYWAAAEAAMRDAGVGAAKSEANFTNYSYPAAPIYSSYYPSPYASVPMPSVADSAYIWPTQMPQYIPPPPPPRPMPPQQYHPRPLQRPQRLDGGTRVPFNYASQQPPQQRQRFSMTFQRPQHGNVNRFASSNPLAPAAESDILGDPNGGFFLRGRHPPALKNYVSRALAHPKTSEERIKCENYLYSKIEPLMLSGTVFFLKWDTEPLPHEKNYELTSSWTPASKLKPNSTSSATNSNKRENRRQESSRPECMSGPDIYLVPPPRSSFSAISESPFIERGKKNKKRKNNNPFGSRFDGDYDMSDAKRVKGEKFGTNHTANWLEDWIESRKNRSRLSNSLNFMSFQERPYRRKAILPTYDGSRLARCLPKVLSNLGQDMVDEYFVRNEGRFDPGDCEEIVG
uniref:Uncharacterized protein n=1 Tax=Panagrolaimus sp. ES5 TaxID=591445 RepID=A0AC34GBA4_9BILA